MAALTSSTTSLHRDMRGESRPFKRDRELSAKWAHGTRHNINYLPIGVDLSDADKPLNYKIRPQKKPSNLGHPPKSHGNAQSGHRSSLGSSAGRYARKAEVTHDSKSPSALSKSLIDLLPSTAQTKNRQPSSDEITYSFDAATGPRNAVGLDSLVEKAEAAWKGKETERIVKKEWEVLDGEGEKTTVVKKKGKSPTVKATKPKLIVEDDDEDWERL